MLAKFCFALIMLACVPGWCQTPVTDTVDTTANTTAAAEASKQSEDSSQLQLPPPVSTLPYETSFQGEQESNFLRGGISISSAWSSNVSWSTTPISDMSYSVWPTIALDKTTYRSHFVFNYAPGFTLYQHATSLNQADQNLRANWTYRLSPYLTATLSEVFQQTSNAFNQPNPVGATMVSGGIPVSTVAVIAPLAETITNATAAQLTYQMSANGMVGASGTYGTLTYPNPQQVAGLYNSRSTMASLFYSTRVKDRSYLGVNYQYQNLLSFQSSSPSTETQIQTVFLFWTMYLKPNLSFSVSGGPQHYSSSQAFSPTTAAWQPMTMFSMNWQGERSTMAVSYSRTISGGGGLNGTFNSNIIAMSYSRQLSRSWNANASGSYSNFQNLTPFFLYSTGGGHTAAGTVSLQRIFNYSTNLQFGYSWTQQNYADLVNPDNSPNASRVFVTLNFIFARPLQR